LNYHVLKGVDSCFIDRCHLKGVVLHDLHEREFPWFPRYLSLPAWFLPGTVTNIDASIFKEMEATEFLISPTLPPIIHGLKVVVFPAELINR
jgi:hypothetical protein